MSNTLGKLYIVATPIGNLGDMTFRAVDVLKSVDCILCEDTRTTKKLLDHYGITNKTMSFHSHSGLSRVSDIVSMIHEGKSLALVSDAGTPCISDPGVMLVAELYKQCGNDFETIAVPGASALISALSISGLPTHEFIWKGFAPHKKGRKTFFEDIAEIAVTVVFYESVHRNEKALESMEEVIPDRQVVVARELTKTFEETIRGTPSEITAYFANHPEKVKGEFVVMVAPKNWK